jgi:hypothetical protein
VRPCPCVQLSERRAVVGRPPAGPDALRNPVNRFGRRDQKARKRGADLRKKNGIPFKNTRPLRTIQCVNYLYDTIKMENNVIMILEI